jgi:hypothetical protein
MESNMPVYIVKISPEKIKEIKKSEATNDAIVALDRRLNHYTHDLSNIEIIRIDSDGR